MTAAVGKLCPYCDSPMTLEEIESLNVNVGQKMLAWHCRNPDCSCPSPDGEYLIYHENIEEPDCGYQEVHLGSIKNEPVARYFFCPFCDNQVELLDSVYYIWNCPNCLLIRSGGMTRMKCRFCDAIFNLEDISHPMEPKTILNFVYIVDQCPNCGKGFDDWYVPESYWDRMDTYYGEDKA